MRHDFDEGKYTVINDNGKLTALRYGEPWSRDLTGDNLIYWMLIEVDKLKQQRDKLLEVCERLSALHPKRGSGFAEPIEVRMARDAIAKATGATS